MDTHQPKPQRRQDLDIYRGIAILAVLSIHVTGHFLSRMTLGSWGWYLLAIPNRALQFAVPAFLMLSALLYSQKLVQSSAPILVAVRRIGSLVTPYLLWSALGIWVTYHHSFQDLTGRHLAKILLWGRGYYHLYFLILLMQLTIIVPLLMPIFARKRPLCPLLTAAVIVQLAFYALNRAYWHLEFIGSTLFWYCVPVILGLWLGQRSEHLSYLFRRYFPAIATITASAFLVSCPMELTVLRHGKVNTFLFQVFDWTFTTGASFVLLAVARRLQGTKTADLLRTLGKRSFALYIAHPFVIFALDKAWSVWGTPPIEIALPVTAAAALLVPLMPGLLSDSLRPLFLRLFDYKSSYKKRAVTRLARLSVFIVLGMIAYAPFDAAAAQIPTPIAKTAHRNTQTPKTRWDPLPSLVLLGALGLFCFVWYRERPPVRG